MSDESHGPKYYVKIWGILMVLFLISVAGPMAEIQVLTLVTAFGIAVVKAYIVVTRFMHINIEKKYVHYFLGGSLAMMALFFAFIAPDVMAHKGQNWTNTAAEAEVKRALDVQHSAHGAHDAVKEAEAYRHHVSPYKVKRYQPKQ